MPSAVHSYSHGNRSSAAVHSAFSEEVAADCGRPARRGVPYAEEGAPHGGDAEEEALHGGGAVAAHSDAENVHSGAGNAGNANADASERDARR